MEMGIKEVWMGTAIVTTMVATKNIIDQLC